MLHEASARCTCFLLGHFNKFAADPLNTLSLAEFEVLGKLWHRPPSFHLRPRQRRLGFD